MSAGMEERGQSYFGARRLGDRMDGGGGLVGGKRNHDDTLALASK